MRKFISLAILAMTFFTSCTDNISDIENESGSSSEFKSKNSLGIPIKDGRLFFNSDEELRQIHYNLANDEDNYSKFLSSLQTNEFLSLNPESNENQLNAAYKYLDSQGLTKDILSIEEFDENYDFAEKVIPEDVLRSLLNINGEIQVAELIYKYTDVGLFSIDSKNYNDLVKYLESNKVSNVLLIPTKEDIVISYSNHIQNIGIGSGIFDNVHGKKRVVINGPINMYIPYDPKNSKNQATAYEATKGSPLELDPNYSEWFNSITECAPRKTVYEWIIGNLFGKHDLCIDKYTKKRRVKVKAWNMDFGLFYSIGVKVKHQIKDPWWRTEPVQQIKALAEAVQFEYNLDLSAVHNHSDYNTYKHNQSYYSNTGWKYTINPSNNFVTSQSFSYNELPTFFHSSLWSMEFYGSGWNVLDNAISNGVNTVGDAKNLNDWFWQGAWTTGKNALSSLGSKFNTSSPNRTVTLKFPQSDKIIVQNSMFRTLYGRSEISQYFDYGGGIRLGWNASAGDFNMSGGAMSGLLKPGNLRIKIIGTAKTSSNGWRGMKLSTF